MKTPSYADVSSQLSESFMRELQLLGISANNLAAVNKAPLANGKPFNIMDLPPEFFYLQNDEGDTQLHLSIIFERNDVSTLLINLAPNPSYLDITNEECLTALHYAVLGGQSNIVRKLVLAGANTTARTTEGDTALHLAVKEGQVECIKALIQPLSFAERESLTKSNILRPLPKLPIHLNVRNYVGKLPIHIAAIKNDVRLVHELLLAGANVNAADGLSGKTALHMAIEKDCAEVVYYLAQIPTTLVATTWGGETAYEIAVECRPHYVETLVRYGAAPAIHTHDDNSMSKDDNTNGDYEIPSYSYMHFTDSYSVNTAAMLVTV